MTKSSKYTKYFPLYVGSYELPIKNNYKDCEKRYNSDIYKLNDAELINELSNVKKAHRHEANNRNRYRRYLNCKPECTKVVKYLGTRKLAIIEELNRREELER